LTRREYLHFMQALAVGIFPYMLKLLENESTDLRQILVFIWAKLIAVDQSCQVDLIKDDGYHYFISVMSHSLQI
jgi:regulator-associated protein of mTOR